MSGVLEQLLILCNQLVVIGYDKPEVLIAGMIIVAAISVMIVAVGLGLVLSVPILMIIGLVKLVLWTYRLWHPVVYAEEEEPTEIKFDYKVEKHKSFTSRYKQPTSKERLSELPPVYPDWMNQKSGRLL